MVRCYFSPKILFVILLVRFVDLISRWFLDQSSLILFGVILDCQYILFHSFIHSVCLLVCLVNWTACLLQVNKIRMHLKLLSWDNRSLHQNNVSLKCFILIKWVSQLIKKRSGKKKRCPRIKGSSYIRDDNQMTKKAKPNLASLHRLDWVFPFQS